MGPMPVVDLAAEWAKVLEQVGSAEVSDFVEVFDSVVFDYLEVIDILDMVANLEPARFLVEDLELADFVEMVDILDMVANLEPARLLAEDTEHFDWEVVEQL
jgi:hypothetical protein